MSNKDELIKQIRSGQVITAKQVEDSFEDEYGSKNKFKYVPPSVADLKGVYASNETLRMRALRDNVPFITSEIKDFRLSQGLILIGAKTGQGKSTCLANIMAGFMESKKEGQKALVITNEESTASVYNRIACVLLKISFKAFHNGLLPAGPEESVQALAQDLINHIIVEEGNKQFDMTDSAHVKAALAYAAEGEFKIACLDYFQTVTKDSSHPERSPMEVSKDLGFFLKDYGRKVTIPIVAFAQLHPNSDMPDFAQRVQNDRTIANHCFVAIEVVPDFDTKTTRMVIHKDRFSGNQGKQYTFGFEGGRYVLEF